MYTIEFVYSEGRSFRANSTLKTQSIRMNEKTVVVIMVHFGTIRTMRVLDDILQLQGPVFW